MPIQIRCTCQQILSVDEAHQGQVVGCPYCGTQLTVPVVQQHAPQPGQQPPPGYGAPPPGYPPQPPANFPPQAPPGQPGWQNPFPQSPPSGPATNPFAGVSAPAPSGNPFANLPTPQSGGGNPFGAPQAPAFPTSSAPAFSNPQGPTFPSSTASAFPNAPGPVSNAPSMPFLAMDVPAKGGPSLNDLTNSAPNVPGDWDESAGMEDPRIWHIPCPNGHILETPQDMLDQDVLCPYCETQFTLRKFQSVEETERREKERAIRDERAGQLWLKWSIGIAVVVIVGIIVMIAISASK